MKSVIVGTAGHIDHGKTALVKALTGIDADRLEEEKRRGITIDLGFAHLELPAPAGEILRLGFIDVPGHERFVRNMLAGVGGIDLVMLVIAADEGVMPQTREHFEICRLLGIPRGLTVITKRDLVDNETLGVVRLEVEEFLRGTFLDTNQAPLVAVSSRTGEGLDELRRELGRVAAEAQSKNADALFRLPIDRVFTMRGFGTVVTGTLIAGSVHKEEEVEVFPLQRRVRVRGVQVHGAAAERATAGQRTALNLAGVEVEELARGMVLATPGLLRATRTLDAQITLLPGAKALKDRARVHLHAYTAETIAEVVLLPDATAAGGAAALESRARRRDAGAPRQPAQLAPGETAFARLKLADPMLLLPDDRFILRQFSPVVTIGGGAVLDAFPSNPFRAQLLPFLRSMRSRDAEEVLVHRIVRRGTSGLTVSDAIAETGWPTARVEMLIEALSARVLRAGNTLVTRDALAAAFLDAVTAVNNFHARNPLVAGISREELRTRLRLGEDVFAAVLESLVRAGKIEVAGEQVRAAGRGVVMKDEEAEAKQKIERAFASAGLKVPALKDVLASLPLDRARAQKLVTLLLRDGTLVKLADDLVFHRDALVGLRRRVQDYKTTAPKLDVARFKDLAGVSRKYAIPLLEYLDRERVTKRVGDERVIL